MKEVITNTNKGKNAIAMVIATLTPELIQNATTKVNAMNIADNELKALTVSLMALDSIDTATTYAKAEQFYKVKKAIESNKSGQFKNFKEYCKHIGVDDSNAGKAAKVFETIISNDSVFPYVDGFNLSALIIISRCKNFSEFIKLIENGTIKVPNAENAYKGTSNAELTKYVNAINSGIVNITPSNIADDSNDSNDSDSDSSSNDSDSDSDSNDSDSDSNSIKYADFAKWLEKTNEKTFKKLYAEFEKSLEK